MSRIPPTITPPCGRSPPRDCYNRRVVISNPRRVAVRALVALVAGAFLVLLAPLDLAAIRLGPLSVLWWYSVIAAPLAAAAIATAALAAARS